MFYMKCIFMILFDGGCNLFFIDNYYVEIDRCLV